jgi:hypothetical protein
VADRAELRTWDRARLTDQRKGGRATLGGYRGTAVPAERPRLSAGRLLSVDRTTWPGRSLRDASDLLTVGSDAWRMSRFVYAGGRYREVSQSFASRSGPVQLAGGAGRKPVVGWCALRSMPSSLQPSPELTSPVSGRPYHLPLGIAFA